MKLKICYLIAFFISLLLSIVYFFKVVYSDDTAIENVFHYIDFGLIFSNIGLAINFYDLYWLKGSLKESRQKKSFVIYRALPFLLMLYSIDSLGYYIVSILRTQVSFSDTKVIVVGILVSIFAMFIVYYSIINFRKSTHFYSQKANVLF